MRRHRLRRILPLWLAASALLTGSAGASHSTLERVSTGPAGGNGEVPTLYRGASLDGARVFMETDEALVAADTDGLQDVYERAGGTTTLLSTGSGGGNGPFAATYAGASADGSRVFFSTREQLAAADTDSSQDIYERASGATTLVSIGPTGGNGTPTASFLNASSAGTRVLFQTTEKLVAGDTDSTRDIYERFGGATTLISTGPAGGNGSFNPIFKRASTDGTRVFFETLESLVSGDTDLTNDVYERSGTTTTWLSLGPAGGNGAAEELYDASFVGSSSDGTRVFVETDELLTSDDVDTTIDVYERSGTTTTRISTGPSGGNGESNAFYRGASQDATKVFIESDESLTGDDSDDLIDVFQRSGGTTTLISTSQQGPGSGFAASFVGASADGSRVFFSTALSLLALDLDGGWRDIYERSGGTTTLLSIGPLGGAGLVNAFFAGASADGSRVFFHTPESLVGADTDAGQQDVYERAAGATTLLSAGPTGGNDPLFGASFAGASQDGARVFVNSGEPLAGGDTDSALDVFAAGFASTAGYPRPQGASPVRVALVPSFEPCEAPSSAHGAPLASASCNPATQSSDHLTVGSPDANGRPAKSVGFVRAVVVPGLPATTTDEADVKLAVQVTDVRSKADLSDYVGQLEATADVRITDRLHGPSLTDPATAVELPFPITVPCTPTVDTTIGANCALTTTADSVLPSAIREGKRAIWQLGQVRVYDGGADGLIATADNTLFAVQGVFVP